jgi:sugar phosphate isomerase/epimerase
MIRICLLALAWAGACWPTAGWAQPPTAPDPLGWRLGAAAWSFNRLTLFEAVDRTAALGLRYLEAFESQRLRPESEAKLTVDLPDEELARLHAKLAEAKVRLTSVYIHQLPGAEAACRKAFEFCRKLRVETIISEPAPEALNLVEQLCDEYDLKVALHNHPQGSSRYWDPQAVLKACEGRSPRLGACADVGHWQRSGIKPVEGVRALGRRLLSLHVKDLNELGSNGHDVWWGTGQGDVAGLLREIHRLGVSPTLFAIEYEYNYEDNRRDIARCAEFFRDTVARISAADPPHDPLAVGWATTDITPPKPVALVGQLHKRISTGVRDPLTATALALETRGERGEREQAMLISCDVLFIQRVVQQRLQEMLKPLLPDLDVRKVFLNATHTHTGPGFVDSTFGNLYDVSKDPGVMKAADYADFFLERVRQAVVEAWRGRKPGALSWALSHAVVGWNRRAHYADGKSVMYGDAAAANFSHVEGPQEPALDLLFFWTPERQWSGVLVNLACTSQETENLNEVSADLWHDVRLALRERHGPGLFVLPQCAPAGDLSPHPIYRQQAQQIMDQRRGLSRRRELARRIANAVDDARPVAAAAAQDRLIFRHTVATVDLPEHQPPAAPFYATDSVHPLEFHVLRLGEVALATNPFELFVDYATRIEARSRATLTLLVQLSCSNSGYLPTERAVAGGGYSADKFLVGPAGGQVLVEETSRRINELFP